MGVCKGKKIEVIFFLIKFCPSFSFGSQFTSLYIYHRDQSDVGVYCLRSVNMSFLTPEFAFFHFFECSVVAKRPVSSAFKSKLNQRITFFSIVSGDDSRPS